MKPRPVLAALVRVGFAWPVVGLITIGLWWTTGVNIAAGWIEGKR